MAVTFCKEEMSQWGKRDVGDLHKMCAAGYRVTGKAAATGCESAHERRRKLSESRDSWLLHWQAPLSSSLFHSYLYLPCPTSAMLRPGLSLFAGQELNLSSVSRMSRALPRSAHTQLSSGQPDLTSLSLPSQAARCPSQVGAARVHRAAPACLTFLLCGCARISADQAWPLTRTPAGAEPGSLLGHKTGRGAGLTTGARVPRTVGA